MQKIKPRAVVPPTKMNTALLGKMSDAAMPTAAPMPTLHLQGKHAKRFHGMKPGAKVSAHVRGTLQSVGMDQYAGGAPTASIQVSHVMPTKQNKKMAVPGVVPPQGNGVLV